MKQQITTMLLIVRIAHQKAAHQRTVLQKTVHQKIVLAAQMTAQTTLQIADSIKDRSIL